MPQKILICIFHGRGAGGGTGGGGAARATNAHWLAQVPGRQTRDHGPDDTLAMRVGHWLLTHNAFVCSRGFLSIDYRGSFKLRGARARNLNMVMLNSSSLEAARAPLCVLSPRKIFRAPFGNLTEPFEDFSEPRDLLRRRVVRKIFRASFGNLSESFSRTFREPFGRPIENT